ncbi:MAG: hypothetical protein D6708_04385 [Candidatus Dadabacteria bacterium]|nr:MAG: hypothetical protein D6708_04385 [Candidatus Dadabacteria bacterium]
MGFWESKPCRVISGLAVVLAVALVVTGWAFGYTPDRWTPATWVALAAVLACLAVCCCAGSRRDACRRP